MILKTELLEHQSPAVEKLVGIRVGALFMEMGTGKTRTAIEIVHRRLDRIWNVIWFCPVSLKQTVAQEIRKHTDATEEDICVWNGTTNGRNLPDVFWNVVGIESMSASRRVILTANRAVCEFSMVIVDESSFIKGHRSARTSWITRIAERARYRMILTGTPLSQGVVDLFSQMRFLHPKILGYASFYSFAHNHLEYSEKYPGMIVRAHNTEWLAAKIQPYIYQVTKDECLDLPDKLFDSRYFCMSSEQRNAYEAAKEEILIDVHPDDFDSYTIFRLFGVLQQIVSGFWHRIRKGEPEEFLEFNSPRIDTLMELIEQLPMGEKLIIWAKFKYDIERIAEALRERFGELSTALFYGAISEKKRQIEVEKFRGAARFFLATQSCGGHGITLNESHYAVFYNNGFKYSERLQSEDRCHRIGQGLPVTYTDIICCESIDERIMTALWAKGNVIDRFKAEVDRVKGSKSKIQELVRSL